MIRLYVAVHAFNNMRVSVQTCECLTTCVNVIQRQSVCIIIRRWEARCCCWVSLLLYARNIGHLRQLDVNYDDRKRLDLSAERFRRKGAASGLSSFSRRLRNSLLRYCTVYKSNRNVSCFVEHDKLITTNWRKFKN